MGLGSLTHLTVTMPCYRMGPGLCPFTISGSQGHIQTHRGTPCVRSERQGEEVRTGNRKGPRLSGGRGERIRGRTGNLRNIYIQNSLPHTESIWGVIPPAWWAGGGNVSFGPFTSQTEAKRIRSCKKWDFLLDINSKPNNSCGYKLSLMSRNNL